MEWISVEDKLPEDYQTVIVLCDGEVTFSCIDGEDGDWYWADLDSYGNAMGDLGMGITHWMPLPKPPKESEEEHEKET